MSWLAESDPHHMINNMQHAEKIRVRALRAMAAREEAEIERDRALGLALEVLRRRQADKRRGIGRGQSAPGMTHLQKCWYRRLHTTVSLWPLLCLTLAFDGPNRAVQVLPCLEQGQPQKCSSQSGT